MPNRHRIKLNIDKNEFKKKLNLKDGENYILTENDKKEIASFINVPIVEKTIEKKEVIREIPIITNNIKEVAKYEDSDRIIKKINNSNLKIKQNSIENLLIDWENIKNKPDIFSMIKKNISSKTYSLAELDDVDLTGLTKINNKYVLTGGSSAVQSVNGKNGVVVLNQDDIGDGTTYKRYSFTEKNKLAGIQDGAEVNVNADWNSTSGDSEILNKPTIPDELSDLSDDSTHRLVTDIEKSTWNGKQDALGFTPENIANKSTNTSLGTSDTLYPTQNAVKTYVDGILSAANALVYKGVIDCSTNPNYPAADAGHLYIISVAGKIGGASGIEVEVGDLIICTTDSTPSGNQATVGSYWDIIQKNIIGAVSGPSSSTSDNIAVFDGATGKLIKDGAKKISDLQNLLISGTNIKTINGNSLLGSGDLSISAGLGSYSAPLYFTTIPSDISGYYKISYTNQATETELTGSVTNEEKLFRTYIYDEGIGTTIIDSGLWGSLFRVKVSNAVQTTKIKFEAFLRHVDNSETTLFSVYSDEINNTTYQNLLKDSPQPNYACLATDRFGVRIYGYTDSPTAVTISTIVGDGNTSWFAVPIAIRHSLLRVRNEANSHPATAISYDNDTSGLVADDVQSAIDEISGDVTALSKERRHDWVEPNDYCGTAPLGSSESDSVWTITRIVVANDGTTTTTTQTNVKWSDRLTIF